MTWQSVTGALAQYEWIGALLARLAVGLLFAISGGGKLFVAEKREQMRETIEEAGLPAPAASATVLSAIELVFGAFLVLGFLTPLASALLIAVMIGALATTVLPGIETDSIVAWLGEVLYLPEVLYIVILLWLLFAGPGWPSVDALVFAS